ncbi:hypothetical protein [Pseudoalteromonas sp. SR43-5]|uniref:hypothetical protein n=1 Tax=Pseudoalteromonas sp. SR43-5 TaxID=2760941 RepID=UPI0015FC67B5|nr:hypothetical protein [Pseudoalteromonas sp. SR43-5]MBB1307816.1 hypothetical protein [Pseudoalteromonas sp. SR43-5]
MKFNKRYVSISLLAASTIVITGCSGTSGTYGTEVDCNTSTRECQAKVRVEGTFGSLLRPVTSLVANLTGFSYSDWSSYDPSEFYLEYAETSSITNLKNRVINVNISNEGVLLGSKSFETKKIGDSVFFKYPERVKEWTEQFIDIATEASFTFGIDSYVAAPSTVSLTVKHNNVAIDTVNYDEYLCGGGNMPRQVCGDSW